MANDDTPKILRPSFTPFFLFMGLPIVCFAMTLYTYVVTGGSAVIPLSLATFLLSLFCTIGMMRTCIELKADTICVRTFLAKPIRIERALIRSVEQKPHIADFPKELRITAGDDASRLQVVSIPAKWYSDEDIGSLLFFLEKE